MKPYKKLKIEMAANDIDQRYLQKRLDRSQYYISDRMMGRRPWNMDDVYAICDLLHISYGLIPMYFPKGGEQKNGDFVEDLLVLSENEKKIIQLCRKHPDRIGILLHVLNYRIEA